MDSWEEPAAAFSPAAAAGAAAAGLWVFGLPAAACTAVPLGGDVHLPISPVNGCLDLG